ncbi:hypothetical protein ABFS83_10G174100 [Erythranthe nasuta]
MEDLMMEENQIIYSKKNTTTRTMNKNSQTISKSKPKIRIIHIFAPEIIKTDAANFRELVQRLTGKPPPEDEDRNILRGGQKKTNTTTVRKKETRIFASSNKKMENMAMMRAGFDHHAEFRERIKGEEEIWSGANSGGGFLGGFAAEFDGFMQELNQFPFLEGTAAQVDVYGEPQLA